MYLELVQILLDIFLELVDIADDVEDDHKCGGEDDSGADECAGDGVVEYSTHLEVVVSLSCLKKITVWGIPKIIACLNGNTFLVPLTTVELHKILQNVRKP